MINMINSTSGNRPIWRRTIVMTAPYYYEPYEPPLYYSLFSIIFLLAFYLPALNMVRYSV